MVSRLFAVVCAEFARIAALMRRPEVFVFLPAITLAAWNDSVFAQGDFGYLSFFLLAEVFFPAIAFLYDNLLENVKKNTI